MKHSKTAKIKKKGWSQLSIIIALALTAIAGPAGAAPNNGAWEALGSGITSGSYINAILPDGSGNVYVGGDFVEMGGVAASNIAKWDGTSWSDVDIGVDGPVNAMAFAPNGDLYVGGTFGEAGGVFAVNLAYFDFAADTWKALSPDPDSTVYALAFDDSGNLYAGGAFTERVKMWDGAIWNSLDGGASDPVYALAIDANGVVYAAGGFEFLGDSGTRTKYGIARWNGQVWDSIGGLNPPGGYALAIDSNTGDLYAGGGFSQVNTLSGSPSTVNYIARWDGSAWSDMDSGMSSAVNDIVVDRQGNVWAAGFFETAGSANGVNGVARWDGSAWHKIGGGLGGGPAYAIALDEREQVYVGGAFSNVLDETGGTPIPASMIAKWDTGNIFSDGFESGDTSAWSNAVNPTGFSADGLCSLCLNTTNPIDGAYDLLISVHNKKAHYLTDETPNGETRYRAYFFVEVKGLHMDDNDKIKVLKGRSGKKTPFQLQIRKNGKKYQIRGIIRTDAGKNPKTKWTKLPKGPTSVEIDWKAAESVGTHNGYIKLYINNVLKVKKVKVNNDKQKVDQVRFGLVAKIKPAHNVYGPLYFDTFSSNDQYLSFVP